MRRAFLMLGLIAFLLGAAGLTLGRPHPEQALAFFGGGVPTRLAAEAVIVVLAWLVIAVAVVGLLAGTLHAVNRQRLLQKPLARATILLAASLVLVIVGVLHRSIPPAQLCCGSDPADISEAIHLAQ
jgi:uncharacterized membrane protein YidH (DUF202 family)